MQGKIENMIKSYIKLLRVKHYIKNLLIFFPLVFGGQLLVGRSLIKTAVGLLAFSLSASIVYIINDLNDVDSDRKHPTKCKRPLASGAITTGQAYVGIVVLVLLVVLLNWLVAQSDWKIWAILAAYLGCNIVYSFGGKHIALLDVFILVVGYLLRIYYGALIISMPISSWLYLTVLSMAFFLGFGKRRNELRTQGESSRKVLRQYSPEFLDKAMYLCLGLTIVFYALWCEAMSQATQNQLLLFSVPLVLLICMRYSMGIEGESDGDPVEVVLADKVLILLVGIYAVGMAAILYGGKLLSVL